MKVYLRKPGGDERETDGYRDSEGEGRGKVCSVEGKREREKEREIGKPYQFDTMDLSHKLCVLCQW